MFSSKIVPFIIRWSLVLLWMLGIWWLSDQPDLQSGLQQDFWLRKVAHMVEFAVLMFLLYRAARLHAGPGIALMAAVSGALLYAGLDEWHQTWVVGRHGSVRDVLIDSVGTISAAVWLRWKNRGKL